MTYDSSIRAGQQHRGPHSQNHPCSNPLKSPGQTKTFPITHGLLYVMYDHTICFFIYTSLYIYIYTCFASSNRRWFRTLTLNLFEVSFSSGQVLLWAGADTRVSAPPLPLAGPTRFDCEKPSGERESRISNCSPGFQQDDVSSR